MRARRTRRMLAALLGCALAAVPASAAQAGRISEPSDPIDRSVVCRGSERLCAATTSLAGADDVRLNVQLPGTNMRLVHTNATPAYVHGAYLLFGGRFSLGGSLYQVFLEAVDSVPRTARLTLTFGNPSTALRCGSIPNGVSFISVQVLRTNYIRRAFSCITARSLGRAWLSRFERHLPVNRFILFPGVGYTCRLVPTLPQNMQCDGGGTRVRFSGPTGG